MNLWYIYLGEIYFSLNVLGGHKGLIESGRLLFKKRENNEIDKLETRSSMRTLIFSNNEDSILFQKT